MKATQLIKGLLWRQITFEEGRITLFGEEMQMTISALLPYLLTNSNDFWKESFFQYDMMRRTYVEGVYRRLMSQKGMSGDKFIGSCMSLLDLCGWGRLSFEPSKITKGNAAIQLEDSAIAVTYKKLVGVSEHPVCSATRGILAGIAAVASKRDDIEAVETMCLAKGDPYCEFLIKPREELINSGTESFRIQLGIE